MTSRRVSTLAALVGLGVLAATARAGPIPTHQSFVLKSLGGVAFQIPEDWGKQPIPDPGWKWQAMAPGGTAHLYIDSADTTEPLASIMPTYLSDLKAVLQQADPKVSFVSHHVSLGSVPAFEIVVRYRAPAAPNRVISNFYVFEHGKRLYVFNYMTTTQWIAKVQHEFDDSVRSVSFPNLA